MKAEANILATVAFYASSKQRVSISFPLIVVFVTNMFFQFKFGLHQLLTKIFASLAVKHFTVFTR